MIIIESPWMAMGTGPVEHIVKIVVRDEQNKQNTCLAYAYYNLRTGHMD